MNKKVCIIGAGPSGLVTIKELAKNNLSIKCFEKSNDIGGVFRTIENDGRSYDSLKLTVSNYFMAYSDFMPQLKENRRYWDVKEYRKYLLEYVEKNNLSKHIYTSHEVVSAFRKDNQVIVTIVNGQRRFNETFDHLVICSGSNFEAKIPNWKNRHLFQGKILHSSCYKNAREFAGKNVLCIGLGESGADIVHVIF
mgnify:FL=1